MIRKILNLKPGTAVTRQYSNAKKLRAFSAANTIIACSVGYNHAKTGSNLTFIDGKYCFVRKICRKKP